MTCTAKDRTNHPSSLLGLSSSAMSVAEKEVENSLQEKLLAVANFITQFQSHYMPGGTAGTLRESNEGVLVSPSDLQAVYEYRDLMMSKGRLEDEYFVAEEKSRANAMFLPVTRMQVRTLGGQLENIQRQIQDCSERSKLIHRLLQRFEVWSTKMAAQQILVAPAKTLIEDRVKAQSCCFSPFLNLPSSKHFCELLPDVSTNRSPVTKLPTAIHDFSPSCCSLPVTPNKHTWQEFARISKMVSLLGSDVLERVYRSPCCIFDLKYKNKYKECYAQQHTFQPHDLVPLWVRAQRNTQAMRHLSLLFQIRVSGEEKSSESVSVLGSGVRGREKQLVVDMSLSQENEGRIPRSFKATFRGNPTYSRARIVEASTLADSLVEWAITNQTLFTYHHVSYYIQTARLRKQKKRGNNRELFSNRKKRMRNEIKKEEDLHRLRSACRSYILRWFARRNRKVTTVLFSTYKNTLHLDIGCIEADRANANMLHGEVDEKISEYLSSPEIDEVRAYKKDRTLARIDRRLEIPRRFDDTITLNSQIQSLMDALGKAAHQYLDLELIKAAKSDFQSLYDHFLDPAIDINDAVSMLLHSDSQSVESIAQTLSDAPSPWKYNCALCDQPGAEGNELLTCANCELPYHDGCSPYSKRMSLHDIIRSYPPLEDLCRIRQPDDVPLPDFRDDDDINWVVEELIIERRATCPGTVSKLGISVMNTEDCFDTLEKLNSGIVLDLAKMICGDRKRGKLSYPLALKFNGCVVINVAEGNSSGSRAGIRPGDVICHLELLDFLTPEDAAEYSDSRSFDLHDVSRDDRLKLLKLRATKLRVRVLRPSKDILKQSQLWYSGVRQINKARTDSMNDPNSASGVCSALWYCGECRDLSSSRENDRFKGVRREAEFCRAVVRRISMESYALPFQSEITTERVSEKGTSVTSLRRLDSMISYIAEDHASSTPGKAPSRAFVVPPWASCSDTRLSWVPVEAEKRPMELLCRGMGVLFDNAMTQSSGRESDIPAAKALFRHFLFAFSSWCVEGCNNSDGTIGPPNIFTKVHSPWLYPSCTVCCGQPCANGSESTCKNAACAALATTFQFQMEDIRLEEVKDISTSLSEYNARSSLVGTTILVLPSDPLVTAVSKVVPIDHDDRPVEFVVASYLPMGFETEVWRGRSRDEGDKAKEGDGIFHLLPILTTRQLTYLLERCSIRNKTRKLDPESDLAWASLDVLNLPGVVRYSFDEVRHRIAECGAIRGAIRTAVIRGSPFQSMEHKDEVQFESSVELLPFSKTVASDEAATVHNDVIETLLYGGVLPTAARDLVDWKSSSSDASDETNKVCPPKDWLITQASGGYAPPDSFGISLPQPGLQSFNELAKNTYSVLAPDNGECLLAYSDLHFENQLERHALDDILRPKRLHGPGQLEMDNDSDCTKIILLERKDCGDKGYRGLGWGFELVQWRQENLIRVGRVCLDSPAQHAGLCTHDVIINACGKKINDFNEVELVTTILGAMSAHVRVVESASDSSESGARIAKVLEVIRASKCQLEPVVITVHRPSLMKGPREVSRSPNTCSISFPRVPDGPAARFPSFAQDTWGGSNVCDRRSIAGKRPLQQVSAGQEATNHDPSYLRNFPTASQIQDSGSSSPPPYSYNYANTVSVSQSRQKVDRDFQSENDKVPVPGLHAVPVSGSPTSLGYLIKLIEDTYSHRPHFASPCLYHPVRNGIIFTVAEASLFLECLKRQQPKLGVRLLCPRYSTSVITKQIEILKTWSHDILMQIPKLTGDLYQYVMKLDFERATNSIFPETGPIVFREPDPTTDGRSRFFEYRLPVGPLPVDRSLEMELNRQQESATQRLQQQYIPAEQYDSSFHQQRVYAAPPADGGPMHYMPYQSTQMGNGNYVNFPGERIRGGGGSTGDRLVEEVYLSDLPVEKWRGVPVYANVSPPEFGGDDKMLVGFAKPPLGTELSSLMTIEFEAHYLEDLGYFEDVRMVPAPSDELFVINMNAASGEGKRAAKIIRELYATNKGPGPSPDQGPLPREIQDEWEASIENNPGERVARVPNPKFRLVESTRNGKGSEVRFQSLSINENSALFGEILGNSSVSPAQAKQASILTDIPMFYRLPDHLSPGINVLGELPDGRNCFWIVNDPTALYVSTYESTSRADINAKTQKEYVFLLKEQEGPESVSSPMLTATHSDRYYCPWGCSLSNVNHPSQDKRREALWFESSKQLDSHYAQFHSFGLLSDKIKIVSPGTFARVEGGHALCDLCADLTAAICARSGSFFKLVVKEDTSSNHTQEGTTFSKSPNGQRLVLSMSGGLRETVAQLGPALTTPNSTAIPSLLHLWDSIRHLFEIENTGLSRYTHDELLKLVAPGTRHRPSCDVNHPLHSCDERVSDGGAANGHTGCSLCTLPWEKTVGWTNVSPQDGEEVSDSETYFGSGCSLINTLIRSSGSNSDDNTTSVPGFLGNAKFLLLQVAANVPDSIKLSDLSTQRDPLSGLRLWDEHNFEVWKSFVKASTCTAMLAQAFVTLLTSIHKNRLPSWWKAEGAGWSTSQVVIASPRLSALLLHVYILDAAIAEFLCKALYTGAKSPLIAATAGASTTQTTRTVLGSTRDRMERYIKLADQLGYSRFNGTNSSECCICLDGGNLLCCELCKNVQHAGCCQLPICDSTILEHWLCDPCINDIEIMIDGNPF